MRAPLEGDVRRHRDRGNVAALKRPHRLAEPAQIRVHADRVRVPGLFGSQEITRATQLEVPQGDPVSRPERRVML